MKEKKCQLRERKWIFRQSYLVEYAFILLNLLQLEKKYIRVSCYILGSEILNLYSTVLHWSLFYFSLGSFSMVSKFLIGKITSLLSYLKRRIFDIVEIKSQLFQYDIKRLILFFQFPSLFLRKIMVLKIKCFTESKYFFFMVIVIISTYLQYLD